MFDKIEIKRTTKEYIPYEKQVKEIKAPTDDSIRLFEEMKEKAIKSIVDSITVNDNVLNFTASLVNDPSELTKYVIYKIKLNGREIYGRVKVVDYFSFDKGTHEIVMHIYDSLSKELASYFITTLLPEFKR